MSTKRITSILLKSLNKNKKKIQAKKTTQNKTNKAKERQQKTEKNIKK
jgi:hypothetical protein